MTKLVAAVYNDFPTANSAVRKLVENGVDREAISMIALDRGGKLEQAILTGDAGTPETENQDADDELAAGAGIGAIIGGLSGLLVGLGALAIPGIGPVVAAGPLAAAAATVLGAGTGAVAGGATGALVGALVDAGVPEKNAEIFADSVRRGGILVAVEAENDMAGGVRDVLNELEPMNLEEKARDWRKANPQKRPSQTDTYTVEQLEGLEYDAIPREFDQGYGAFVGEYQRHFEEHLSGTGSSFEEYLPAYRLGYNLAADERYREADWEQVQNHARQTWEVDQENGAWDDFKSAVHYAWEEVRERME